MSLLRGVQTPFFLGGGASPVTTKNTYDNQGHMLQFVPYVVGTNSKYQQNLHIIEFLAVNRNKS